MPTSPDHRDNTVIGAYLEGWRRVLRAPAVWAGLLIAGLVSALAPAVVVRARLDTYMIPSGSIDVSGEALRLARTLSDALPLLVDPSTVAVNALQSTPLDSTMAASLAWRLGLVIFLWGGVLDRLARARPVGSAAFFAACGVYLWRFLRLMVPLGLLYWAIDRALQPYAIAEFVALVLLLIVADFAKVRAVVEDRRSMLGALLASARFVRRRPVAVLALALLNLGAIASVVALGQIQARVEMGLTLPLWITYLQSLVAALLWLWARLAFAASEIVLFQNSLAHAGYTAAPLPVWPDSPAAEAIENLAGQKAEGRRQM
jgi:hypothetical protein